MKKQKSKVFISHQDLGVGHGKRIVTIEKGRKWVFIHRPNKKTRKKIGMAIWKDLANKGTQLS